MRLTLCSDRSGRDPRLPASIVWMIRLRRNLRVGSPSFRNEIVPRNAAPAIGERWVTLNLPRDSEPFGFLTAVFQDLPIPPRSPES